MMNKFFYKYIFYKFYKIAKKTEKQWNVSLRSPELISFMTMFILNIYQFILLSNFITTSQNTKNKMYFIFLFFILTLNYYLFIYRKNFLIIEKEFDTLTRTQRRSYDFYFYAIILCSILLVFI